MNTELLALSDRLKALRDEKSDIDKRSKEINAEIESITMQMIDLMTTEELTSFNRNGTTFSLVTTEYPSPEPERKGELWEAMKRNGFEDCSPSTVKRCRQRSRNSWQTTRDFFPCGLKDSSRLRRKTASA